MAFIKNLLNFFFNMGDPVGPLANFLAIASFLLAAYYIYRNKRNKQVIINRSCFRYSCHDHRIKYFKLFCTVTTLRHDI